MATCQQSQNLAGSKLNHILLYAERQTPFNPDEMDIEQKLFALPIWIWVGTVHQIQPEAPRRKFLCLKSAFISTMKAHLSNDRNSLCP